MKKLTLEKFSELSASSEPVPGGGGVSASVGALAASLGEMVTNLTIGKKKYLEYTDELEEYRKQLSDFRIELLDCIDKDAEAFRPLSQAYKLPKDTENYDEIIEKCLRDAADSPYNILLLTKRIIDIDERLATIGSKLSVSDAATSVMLAQGVLYGAYINILVNTRLMKDKEYADNLEKEVKNIVDKYASKALEIFNRISERL